MLDRLKEFLHFEPETGIFFNKKTTGKAKEGTRSGSLRSNGGRDINVLGKTFTEFQLVWYFTTGEFPETPIMPINGDPSDSRFENLMKSEPIKLKGETITQEELKHYFTLDEDTFRFSRRVTVGPSKRKKAGSLTGSVGGTGYRRTTIAGKVYSDHHLIWLWYHGKLPTNQIDHLNHNRLDNRLENLREVTHADNGRNMSRSKRNKSGKTGVWLDKKSGKWCSEIFFEGKKHILGSFTDFDEACKSRIEAEKKFGFHKNHGKLL